MLRNIQRNAVIACILGIILVLGLSQRAFAPICLNPTASFSGPSKATVGQEISFDPTASILGGPSTYRWDFGDGTRASGEASGSNDPIPAITHIYSKAGTYGVRLTITHKPPCSAGTDSVLKAIVINESSATPTPPPSPAATFGWAYLWADFASSTSTYTPNTAYQFNSTGAPNTVVRTGLGSYTANLPGLGDAAGVVHVTAYAGTTETCKVVNWNPSGTTQQIKVTCFNIAGAAVDSRFTLTYAHPGSSTFPMAYLWADQASATSVYTPNTLYQFNSKGAINTVVRTGVGAYTANLPGVGSATGHVQVTAYGSGSERCKVVNWNPSGTTQQIKVICFNIAGAAVDSRFTLTYVSGTSVVGSSPCSRPGTSSAYAWADQSSSASYTPNSSYQFGTACTTGPVTVTITRSGVGAYAVKPGFLGLGSGDVQVTAYGSGSEYCKVVYWTPTDGIKVQCFTSAGAAVDTRFDVTFLSSNS